MNPAQTNLEVLAARVSKLEASHRHWKLANAALLLSDVSPVFMGAAPTASNPMSSAPAPSRLRISS